MATGLGGLFTGLNEGFQTGWKFGEKMEVRDKKRRAAELAKLISTAQNDHLFGRGEFKEGEEQSAPAEAPRGVTPQPEDAGVVVQPYNPEPLPQGIPLPADGSSPPMPTAGVRGLAGTPSGQAPSPAPELRGVQVAPAAQPVAPAAPEAPKAEPTNPVEAMFKTRYKNPKAADDLLYNRLNEYYTELYTVTEQYDKIPQLRTMLREMREKEFEPRKRIGSALIGTGSKEGFQVLGEAASIAGLNFEMDASNASFDEKTMAWNGLVMVQDGKRSAPFNASVEQLWQQLAAITPAEAVNMRLGLSRDARDQEKLNIEKADLGIRQEEQGRKGRETDAQIQYWKDSVQTKRLEIKNKLEELGIYKSAQALNIASQASGRAYESIGKSIGLSKEYKPEELALMGDDEKKAYLAERGAKMEVAGFAHNLWQMNNFRPDGSLQVKMPESVALEITRADQREILKNSTSNGDGTRTLTFRGRQYLIPDPGNAKPNEAPGNDPFATFRRSKNRDGSFAYTPDPKGLTKYQWQQLDSSGIPE